MLDLKIHTSVSVRAVNVVSNIMQLLMQRLVYVFSMPELMGREKPCQKTREIAELRIGIQ